MTMSKKQKPKKIEIQVDGETFEVEDREMTVAELLALVELDPGESYLIELHGQSEQGDKHEDADEVVKLHANLRFITGDRAPAPVA